jgi:hypothetical protein
MVNEKLEAEEKMLKH